MSTTPQLLFQIRPEYGILQIESLTALAQSAGRGVLLEPPLPQPFSEGGMLSQKDPQILHRLVFSRPWNRWFEDVWRWITASSPGAQTVQFLVPSVDESDAEWFGTATINATDDPATAMVTLSGQSRYGLRGVVTAGGSGYSAATFTIESQDGSGQPASGTATIVSGAVVDLPITENGYGLVSPLVVVISGDGTGAEGLAVPGRQWEEGDFIIWNDPTINSTSHQYQYEIDQIKTITPIDATSATFEFQRAGLGATAGQAQYGSSLNSHTTKHFYRLINELFTVVFNPDAGPQVVKIPWPNMMMAAVQAFGAGLNPILVNLAPLPYLPGTTTPNPLLTPPSPGVRTMNGAAYTTLGIAGSLSVGMTGFAVVGLQANENSGPDSIRTVHFRVETAPTGPTTFHGNANACIVIYTCMINPDDSVWLIDTSVIDAGKKESWSIASNSPTYRQMPYHPYWPKTAPNQDWPPNRLPLVDSGLIIPLTVEPTSTAPFAPDAKIQFIVAQVGTGIPGADLTGNVQT